VPHVLPISSSLTHPNNIRQRSFSSCSFLQSPATFPLSSTTISSAPCSRTPSPCVRA
jgi:hypothetical protein